MTPATFTCPRCGRTSHHPDDAYYRYCGACHAFMGNDGPLDAENADATRRLREAGGRFVTADELNAEMAAELERYRKGNAS